MKDAECAETNEKSIFVIFNFSDMAVFVIIIGQFLMNFHHNSKNKNRKIDFSFVSAHSAEIC